MAALAMSIKTRFSLWQDEVDVPLIYTIPSKALAPEITKPKGIEGNTMAVELVDWVELDGVFEAVGK